MNDAMQKAVKLLTIAHRRNIRTFVTDGQLGFHGPPGAVTPEMRHLLHAYEPWIVRILPDEAGPSAVSSGAGDGQSAVAGGPPLRTAQELLADAFTPRPEDRWEVRFGAKRLPFTIWAGAELAGPVIAIDTETAAIVAHDIPRLILATVSDGKRHYVVARDRVRDFLYLHRDRFFVAHNAAFDHWVLIQFLREDAPLWWKVVDQGRLRCTNLLEQLVLLARFDKQPYDYSLDDLAEYYCNTKLFGKHDPRRLQFDTIEGRRPDEIDPWFFQYAVQDAIAAWRVYREQRQRALALQPDEKELLPDALKKYGLLSEVIQVKASITLAAATRNGMCLDQTRLGPTRVALREQLFETAAALEEAAGVPICQRYKMARFITEENRGYKLTDTGAPRISMKAVRAVFREVGKENKLAPPLSDKGELSLTKHFWTDYQNLHPAIEAYLQLQAQTKLFGFFASLEGAERVHSRYVPIVRSGRVSCRQPNIQQIPRAGGVREVFIPTPGYVLYVVDFAALELRTLAAVCLFKYGKSKLAEVFKQGIDAHTYAYCQIHGKSLEDFKTWKQADPAAAKAARNKIKPISFGVPGSMQAGGLAQYAKRSYGQNLTREEAGELRLGLIETFPEWKQFLDETGSCVHTLTGRVRSKLKRIGQLYNTQFQGIAGDGAKLCMYALLRAGFRLTAFVHDEFHIELPLGCDYDSQTAQIDEICCRVMSQVTPGVPIEVEGVLTMRWSKQAEPVRDEYGRLVPWTVLLEEAA